MAESRETQCLLSRDSVADGPSENSGCTLDSCLWSLARHTTGTASSHLGMSIQKQAAGGGEVETSLEEVLSGQEQVVD